jgi:hypothetical protein
VPRATNITDHAEVGSEAATLTIDDVTRRATALGSVQALSGRGIAG